jgi:hypothetical protein
VGKNALCKKIQPCVKGHHNSWTDVLNQIINTCCYKILCREKLHSNWRTDFNITKNNRMAGVVLDSSQ